MQYLENIRSKLKTLNSVVSKSGGWAYHRKHALNFKKWRSFQRHINLWLHTKLTPHSQGPLLLVGPSAGYSLSDEFLSCFAQINAVELDPLSPLIWKIQHKEKIKAWANTNYFQFDNPFSRIRQDYPEHRILFCNLLGQLAYDPQFNTTLAENWASDLRSLQNWLSYHDLYSLHGSEPILSKFALEFREPLQRADLTAQLLAWTQKLEVLDHRTQEFIPETSQNKYFLWRIDKNSLHIVEGTSNSC